VAAAVRKQLALGVSPIMFSALDRLGIDELWRAIGKAVAAPGRAESPGA
jgi:hypothetical protein